MGILKLVPTTLEQANAFIALVHRHHEPAQGHRVSFGVELDGKLVGTAILGRPVSQELQKREPRTAEVTRVCSDGTLNVCSMLYGAAARAAKALGYTKVITYFLLEESGASARAAGWVPSLRPDGSEWISDGGEWGRSKRPRKTKHPTGPKRRWEIRFERKVSEG